MDRTLVNCFFPNCKKATCKDLPRHFRTKSGDIVPIMIPVCRTHATMQYAMFVEQLVHTMVNSFGHEVVTQVYDERGATGEWIAG